jgi:hypothetical protein
MPPGLPTPQELVDGEVSFFSLDTDVIQAAGYNFSKGALNQLPRQLPIAMKLQLTEVVLREIVGHKLEPVKEAADKFQASIAGLTRLTGLDFGPADAHFNGLDVLSAAQQKFEADVKNYVTQCGGDILPISDIDPELLFARYFAGEPPFGLKADKKSEFPDAAALLLLEEHATERATKGILASRDAGWKAFADQSPCLYCVTSLDDLAALFAATDAHAQAVRDKIAAAVGDETSALRTQLTDSLKEHVSNADWDASELYSGSQRIESEVSDVALTAYYVHNNSLNVWKVDDEPGAWVVELITTITVDVTVSVQFFIWDSIDREELAFGHDSFTFSQDVDVDAYLTCHSVTLETAPVSWEIEVEIGSGKYSLDAAEVEPDFSDHD